MGYRPEYIQVIKVKKPAVARHVVAEVKKLNPPGRFLKREESSKQWYVVSDKNAAEKASQALREKTSKEKNLTGRFMKQDDKTGKWIIIDCDDNKNPEKEKSSYNEDFVTSHKKEDCTQESSSTSVTKIDLRGIMPATVSANSNLLSSLPKIPPYCPSLPKLGNMKIQNENHYSNLARHYLKQKSINEKPALA